jgi:hypothetical protein
MVRRSQLMVSSIVAAVLFSIGFVVTLVIPGGGEVTEQDFTDFYGTDDRFFISLLLVIALVAASWALAWFFSALRAHLPADTLSGTAYAVALIGAAAVPIGAAILLAPVGVQMNSDAEFVGMPIAHTFAQAGLLVMLLVGMYSLAAAVALFSLAMRRANVGPSWLSIAGLIIAVLLIGSFVVVPGYLFPIWVVLVGVLSTRDSRT